MVLCQDARHASAIASASLHHYMLAVLGHESEKKSYGILPGILLDLCPLTVR